MYHSRSKQTEYGHCNVNVAVHHTNEIAEPPFSQGVNASGGLFLDNGGRVRRRVTPVVALADVRPGRRKEVRNNERLIHMR